MALFDKLQIFFILASAGVGLVLGQNKWFSLRGDNFVVPFLILMLTIVFLNVPFRDMKKAFINFKFSSLSLSVNFLWTPVFAWILGMIFLKEHPDLWVGFFILLITPVPIGTLFSLKSQEEMPPKQQLFCLGIFFLQLILLPFYLYIFAGKLVPLEFIISLESIALVLLIPFGSSFFIRRLIIKLKDQKWHENNFLPQIMPAQFIFLCLAIIAMFSSQGEAIITNPKSTLLLIPPLLSFYILNLVLSWSICRFTKIDEASSIGFVFSTLARNSPLALVIAVTTFPDKPLIALTLVIGPLIELPTLAAFTQFFKLSKEEN